MGVATGRVVDAGGVEPVAGQAGFGGLNLGCGVDFDAEVVEGATHGAFDEDELEWRVGDGEVGVSGFALGGLRGEQLGVELDGLVDIGHVEGELDS